MMIVKLKSMLTVESLKVGPHEEYYFPHEKFEIEWLVEGQAVRVRSKTTGDSSILPFARVRRAEEFPKEAPLEKGDASGRPSR